MSPAPTVSSSTAANIEARRENNVARKALTTAKEKTARIKFFCCTANALRATVQRLQSD